MKQEMGVLISAKNDSWITPVHVVEKVRRVLGSIELDPASSEDANRIVKAERFFSREDDSLTKEWLCETFFLNPPYGKTGSHSTAGMFCEYAHEEFVSGRARSGIILLHSRFGYGWFEKFLDLHTSCTLRDRLRFLNPDTLLPGGQAKTAQTLFLLGRDSGVVERFCEVFSADVNGCGFTVRERSL